MRRRISKLLHRPKVALRQFAYPVQHRLGVTFARPEEREAVMVFDPSSRYGGWIDRVKGIISTYELARLTGRRLRIHAGPTFPVDHFLEPATFDWRVPAGELAWNPLSTGFHVSRDRPSPDFVALQRSTRRSLFVETNLDYVPRLHPSASPDEQHALWGTRFRELFRPRPAFADQVEAHAKPDSIALHARFTSLLGDFTDVTDKTLPPADRAALLDACLAEVRRLSAERPHVTVFSDSITFLSSAAAVAPNVRVLPGNPSHIDHTLDAVESLRKTLLDFYVMMRCSEILLLRIGRMYDSKFSRYASYVASVPFCELTGA